MTLPYDTALKDTVKEIVLARCLPYGNLPALWVKRRILQRNKDLQK